MRIKTIPYCVTILLQFFLFQTEINAQVEEIIDLFRIRDERTLNNHIFTPTAIVKSPFILTKVRTSLGLGGIEGIQIPVIEINDKEYKKVEGEILVALLGFGYQHSVKDWLAVHLRFGLVGRLGTDFATVLTEGLDYTSSFNIGWLAKVYRNEKFMLSANIEVNNGNYSFINLQNFIDDIVANNKNAELVKSNNTLYGLSGIRTAYGFNKLLGVELMADLGYGETIQRDKSNSWFYILGLNFDLNFTDYINTPIAFSFGYLTSSYTQGNNNNPYHQNLFFGQLSYVGRSNVVLSLDFQFSKELSSFDGQKIWIKSASFTMRYLF